MFQLFLLQVSQPVPTALCLVCAWTLMAILLWSIWVAFPDGTAHLRRLHQIPCSRCVFFTKNYRLKCTVHPYKALTESAINCPDYEPTTYRAKDCSKRCKQ